LPTRTAIKVKSRRDVISGVARKRDRFDLGHEMNRSYLKKEAKTLILERESMGQTW